MYALKINNLPSVQRSNFSFNEINRSNSHNKFQKEVVDDILDLFNKMNVLEHSYNNNIRNIKLENSYLESIHLNLFNELEKLKRELENTNNIDKVKEINALECSNIYNDDSLLAANIDTVSNDITSRGSRKESKIAIYDAITSSMFLPETLSVEVVDTTKEHIISSQDSSLYSPFDNSNDLYYIRDVVAGPSINFVTCDYIITLPSEIATNDTLNEIFVEPFLCSVTDVQIRQGDSAIWETVDGFNYHRNNKIKDCFKSLGALTGGTKLNFKDKKANQIKISLKCDKFTERESNIRKFTYGLKQVGAYYNKFNGTESTFQFIADLSVYGEHEFLIKEVYPEFNNAPKGGAFSSDFSQDIYYLDENNHEYKIIDSFPFVPTTNKLMIKCRFGTRYPEMNISKVNVVFSHI